MTTDLENIKSTLSSIAKGEGILDMLMEFERTLDNSELFTYKNWIMGELEEGPIIDRYWFKVVFMYPHKLMPDPLGGLRLRKLGAKVHFKKGTFKKPVKVKGPQDWSNINTKATKIGEHKVWLVTIDLPMRYINYGLENNDNIIQKDIDSVNDELSNAYDDQPEDDQSAGPDDGLGDIAGTPDDTGMQDQQEGQI